MKLSKRMRPQILVFALAVALTALFGIHPWRSDAIVSPGTFASSPISPLPTPTPTATATSTATPRVLVYWLPLIRQNMRRQWLPLVLR
jgi:hypothetical protein